MATKEEKPGYGWDDHGEYNCPCGTMFGKNLLGDMPHLLVKNHVRNCVKNALQRLNNGHPINKPLSAYGEDVWNRAVREYLKG